MDTSGTIFLTVAALTYTIIIMIIFFSKKKISNLENKIFNKILIITVLSMLTELLIVFTLKMENISIITQKLFLVLIILWISIFMEYTLVLTLIDIHKENNIKKKYEKYHYLLLMIALICSIIIMILPIKFNDINGAKYTSGPSVNFVFIITGLYMIVMFGLLITNTSKIKEKKFVPIVVLILLLSFAAIIQATNPQILLTNFVFGIVVGLMYFTIENPDLKIIEELKKNRSLTSKSYIEKSNFLFRMSAEVRKPIDNIGRLNNYNLESNDIKEIKENSSLIDLNVRDASFTLNNILDVTSLDSKKINIVKNEKYSIIKLLNEIKIRESKKINNIRFEFNISESIPEYLYGDSVRLKQVLTTIIDKSINDTKEGFIEINVNSINKYDVCRLIITIENSSKPLSLEEINNILDNDKKINDSIDEMNININNINKIINMMNGTLMIKSDNGNEFTIVVDSIIVEAKKEEIINETDILLVSNNEKLLKKLEPLFDSYTINTVLNGIDMIDLIRSGESYNLIIIDDEMKPISGLETLKKLKELDINIPCIIMLDEGKEKIKNHYIKDGFIDYILKNNLKEEVNKIIRKML